MYVKYIILPQCIDLQNIQQISVSEHHLIADFIIVVVVLVISSSCNSSSSLFIPC